MASTIACVKLEVRLGHASDVDGAAQVWARATSKRDGKREIAPLAAAKDVLLDSLQTKGSIFVVAADRGEVLGFATAEPAASSRVAEVRYVGVDPDRWGCGIGRMVLARMADELASAGFRSAQLLVYADNVPARRLYEGMGWEWDRHQPSIHPHTGKPEVRYLLPLSSGSRLQA
jgi:ribosomal protein S18 acetylase RimI-like enzyme